MGDITEADDHLMRATGLMLVHGQRLDVRPIAEELVKAIIGGVPDERLKVTNDGNVQLVMGKIIPATNEQTTTGRRRRLRGQLNALLEPHGWQALRANVYSRQC